MSKATKQRLRVSLCGGRLVISIGIETLCNAAEKCELFYDSKSDAYTLKISDKQKFAGEIVRALQHEEEDGTTPLHVLFDSAFEAAVDDGCDGIAYPEEAVHGGRPLGEAFGARRP